METDDMTSLTSTEAVATGNRPAPRGDRIDDLFALLAGAYPGKFFNSFHGLDIDRVKTLWRGGLARLTDAEIKNGVAASQFYTDIPDLPGFIVRCRPDRAPHVLFERAQEISGQMERDYEGDAVLYWSLQEYGFSRIKGHKWYIAKDMWCQILGNNVRLMAAGKLPPIPKSVTAKALPAPGRTEPVNAKVKAMIQGLRDKLAGGALFDAPSTDWAHKAIADHESGKPIPFATLRAAQEVVERKGARA